MIDRVDQGFLNGGVGEVPDPRSLCAVGMLDDCLAQVVALDVAQGFARHPRQWPFEGFFFKAVTARTFGKPDHINLHAGEKPLRRLIEKQQPHVLGPRRFGGAARHVHLPRQRLNRQTRRVRRQCAAHLLQKFQHQGFGKVIHSRRLVVAVVKRHLGGQAQQFLLNFPLGFHCAAVAPDVIAPDLVAPGRHRLWRLVRAVLAARRPQHKQLALLKLLNAQHGEIRRLNQLAVRQQLALDFVQLLLWQTQRRKHRLAIGIAILPNHHVAAAEVFKVVGKGA